MRAQLCRQHTREHAMQSGLRCVVGMGHAAIDTPFKHPNEYHVRKVVYQALQSKTPLQEICKFANHVLDYLTNSKKIQLSSKSTIADEVSLLSYIDAIRNLGEIRR